MVRPRCPVCDDYSVIKGSAGQRCPCDRLILICGRAYISGHDATEITERWSGGEDSSAIASSLRLTAEQVSDAILFETHRQRLERQHPRRRSR